MHTVDTTLLHVVLDLVVDVRVVQHCFRRNTPNIEACSTKSASLLYADSLGARIA